MTRAHRVAPALHALRIHRLFPPEQLAVIGLHTVFAHHDVMGPQALRIRFPAGIGQLPAEAPGRPPRCQRGDR